MDNILFNISVRSNGNEINNSSWGEFSYLREFLIYYKRKKYNCNGWIVQYISRNTNVIDRQGNTYTTESEIRQLTSNHVLASNIEYVEFFCVKNGDIIDEETSELIDDRFQGGPIKKYENGETTIDEEDDTGGVFTMESKAYFIKNIVNGTNIDELIKSIGKNVDTANGLISSYGSDDYFKLLNYRNSNIWCSNVKVSWNIPDENTSDKDAGLNHFEYSEHECHESIGGKKKKRKSTKKTVAKKKNVKRKSTKKRITKTILSKKNHKK